MCDSFGKRLLDVSKRVDQIMKNRVSEISDEQAKATTEALNGIGEMAKELIEQDWTSECPNEVGVWEWRGSPDEGTSRLLAVGVFTGHHLQVSVPQMLGPNREENLVRFCREYPQGQWRAHKGVEEQIEAVIDNLEGDPFKDSVLEMDADELRSRVLCQRDYLRRFYCCLDDIKIPKSCDQSINGCRDHHNIADIVTKLVNERGTLETRLAEAERDRDEHKRIAGRLGRLMRVGFGPAPDNVTVLAQQAREALAELERLGNERA